MWTRLRAVELQKATDKAYRLPTTNLQLYLLTSPTRNINSWSFMVTQQRREPATALSLPSLLAVTQPLLAPGAPQQGDRYQQAQSQLVSGWVSLEGVGGEALMATKHQRKYSEAPKHRLNPNRLRKHSAIPPTDQLLILGHQKGGVLL